MMQSCLNVAPAVSDVGRALKQHWFNVSCLLGSAPVINRRPNTATLNKCWASVVGGVPALKQRWLHVIVQRYACLPVWSVCPRGIQNNTRLTQGGVDFDLTSCLCWPANTHVWGLYAYRPLTAQQNKHSLDVTLMLVELLKHPSGNA